jgi:hypothetical protein
MISGAGIGTSLSGDEPEESNDEGLGTSARQIRVVPGGVRLAQDWQIPPCLGFERGPFRGRASLPVAECSYDENRFAKRPVSDRFDPRIGYGPAKA